MALGINNNKGGGDEINLIKVWTLFRSRWWICLIALGMALILCKLYVRYARPVYKAAATIRIEEENNPTQGLGLLESLGNFSSNIQSEIRVLRSRSLMMRALRDLNINAKYYLVGTIVTAEMHRDDSPFLVDYDSAVGIPYGKMFSLRYVGGDQYRLTYSLGDGQVEETYRFMEPVKIGNFIFKVIKRDTPRYKLTSGIEYRWEAVQWKSFYGRAREGLYVDQTGHMVPILKITHDDEVPKFSADLVNTLLRVYVQQDKEIRTQAANQQLEFIRSQVDTIKRTVENAERILQNFKRDNQFFGLDQKFSNDMEEVKANKTALTEYELRLRQISRLEKEVNSGTDIVTFPFSLEGTSEPVLIDFISTYNTIVREKLVAMQSYQPGHPRIEEMDRQLRTLRQSIEENISSLRDKIFAEVNFYKLQVQRSENALLAIPETQRQYLSLIREYEVQENILSTLLEKQAEAQIAKASIVSPVRIVDKALVPIFPVSPDRFQVYVIGTGLGLAVGILAILLIGMLNNRINYREEIENISLTPILGSVRKSSSGFNQKYPKLVVADNPKSSLSESIRSIRTNLQFIVGDKGPKTIAITSTVSGEGKSFIIINLAGVISMLNKKVVVLDLDLRRPKLHFSFESDNLKGISTFLSEQHELVDVLQETEFPNLSIITSGPIPPNPAELVQSHRMEQLLTSLREKFDYILIDTPPIGLVTDGAIMFKQADVSLYVIRAEYSRPAFATMPDKLVEEQHIKNLYIIFNSVDNKARRYGGYGYKSYRYGGYYSDEPLRKPHWWKFLKRWREQRARRKSFLK